VAACDLFGSGTFFIQSVGKRRPSLPLTLLLILLLILVLVLLLDRAQVKKTKDERENEDEYEIERGASQPRLNFVTFRSGRGAQEIMRKNPCLL
jgi:hypothetical protein